MPLFANVGPFVAKEDFSNVEYLIDPQKIKLRKIIT